MVASWITTSDLENPTSPYADDAVAAATHILFLLSGRKYAGISTITEVYCQAGRPCGQGITTPVVMDGRILNECAPCDTCGCPHLIRLRGAPIRSIQSVYDGERLVPLSDIAIYDYSYITAPGRCWGTCGELEVTYTYGAEPPALAKLAAKDLADQYIYAFTDDDRCHLPQRITSVSRQGVSWTLLDPQDFLDSGRTGLYQVDLFLRSVNPSRALLRPRVFSPDLPRGKSYRWAAPAPGFLSTQVASAPAPAPAPTAASTTSLTLASTTDKKSAPSLSKSPTVSVYEGRRFRWVVPGDFSADNPPTIAVRTTQGTQTIPAENVVRRTNSYTLDLSASQSAQYLPDGAMILLYENKGGTERQVSTIGPVRRSTP